MLIPPFVLQYSLAYACLKLVNYSFFFWLPFYLSNNYGWKEAEADRLSVWYDVGGIIGEPPASLVGSDSQLRGIYLQRLCSFTHRWDGSGSDF